MQVFHVTCFWLFFVSFLSCFIFLLYHTDFSYFSLIKNDGCCLVASKFIYFFPFKSEECSQFQLPSGTVDETFAGSVNHSKWRPRFAALLAFKPVYAAFSSGIILPLPHLVWWIRNFRETFPGNCQSLQRAKLHLSFWTFPQNPNRENIGSSDTQM